MAAFPDDARAWEALGSFALDRRDYRRAEEAHRALVRLQPEDTAAWLRLGATLARQEKWREAREAIARARELDPRAPVDAELVAFLERKAAGRALSGPAFPPATPSSTSGRFAVAVSVRS